MEDKILGGTGTWKVDMVSKITCPQCYVTLESDLDLEECWECGTTFCNWCEELDSNMHCPECQELANESE